MTDHDALALLSDLDVFALTLWAEARSQTDDGIRAVAHVIRNRVLSPRMRKLFGRGWKGVCLQPWQFSCWNDDPNDHNHTLLMDVVRQVKRPEFRAVGNLARCYGIARETMRDDVPDEVHGADHYLTAWLLKHKPPRWAADQAPVCTVGDHVFFNLYGPGGTA